MNACDFLTHLWADGPGFFCIATPSDQGNGYKQRVFDTIANAAAFATSSAPHRDVYFNIHVLKNAFVNDPLKKNADGTIGGKRVRTHANMRGCSCLYTDLDVGSTKSYKTRDEALGALATFVTDTGLPYPTVVSSGGGFHLYWPFTRELESDAWHAVACSFAELMKRCEFRVDPVRTKDKSSVLRVVGTLHHKDRNNPRKVEVIGELTAKVEPERLMHLIDSALDSRLSISLPPPGSLFAVDPANLPKGEIPDWYAKPPTAADVGKVCAQFRWAVRHQAECSEPEWYHILNVARWTLEGRAMGHLVSSQHPGYTVEATDAKLDQLERIPNMGPATCEKIDETFDNLRCRSCQFHNAKRSSPIAHARNRPKEPTPAETELGIPEPPQPYSRTDNGIRMAPVDAAPIIICEHDLYPLRLVHNEEDKRTDTAWAVTLPKRGTREFVIPADVFSDNRKLEGLLRHIGVFTKYENYKLLREYMSAYIQQLQKYAEDQKQYTHLGWTEEYKSFILPTRIVTAGTSKPVSLNDSVQAASSALKTQGTANKQIELLRFYKDPGYARQAFFITCSLAAPLLHATGQYGALVNMSGDSGASKSSSLYTAAGFWGSPTAYTINGTGDGATIRARNERTLLMSNLPVCVDEITLMEREVAKNLAMSITQEGGRIRLHNTGAERKQVAAMKSTFMLTTSNNSFHDLLASNNATGTAGSMRVFEIICPRLTIHNKREADDYLREIKLNFGHVGSMWIDHLTRHRERLYMEVVEMQRRVDDMGSVAPHERFWSATIAVVLVTCQEAQAIGLLPFDMRVLEEWALSQLDMMRGVVGESYVDPIDGLLAYIASAYNNLLVVRHDERATTVLRPPQGGIAGRYEVNTGNLYLIYSNMKTYCLRTGVPLIQLTADLRKLGIVKQERATIGRGLAEFNVGQHPVLTVDMRHPSMVGAQLGEIQAEDGKIVSIKTGKQ